MRLYSSFLFFLVMILGNVNCQAQYNIDNSISTKQLNSRFVKLLEYPIDSLGFPRSMSVKTGVIKKVPSKDWTSGFYVGTLWQLYTLTGDIKYKEYASKWNSFLEKEKFNNRKFLIFPVNSFYNLQKAIEFIKN